MTDAPRRVLTAPQKGQTITADFLGALAAGHNALRAASRITAGVSQTIPPQAPTEPGPSEIVNTLSYRESETVRVENPSNPAQYVDVERDTLLRFVGNDGITREYIITY